MGCLGLEGGTIRRVVAEVARSVEVPVDAVSPCRMEERNPHGHVVLHHVAIAFVSMIQSAVLYLTESVDGLAVGQTERLRHIVGIDGVRSAFGERSFRPFAHEYRSIWTIETEYARLAVADHLHPLCQQGVSYRALVFRQTDRLGFHGHHNLRVGLSQRIRSLILHHPHNLGRIERDFCHYTPCGQRVVLCLHRHQGCSQ